MHNVHPILLHEVVTYTPINGTYAYNPNGRMLWLQKICFWILSKLSCTSSQMNVGFKVHSFDSDKLIDIIKEQEHVMYQVTTKRCKYVLVGRDHYERLIGESDYMTYRMFEFPQTVKGFLFRGIKVVFIPWMTGMVAVPELSEYH